MNARFRPKTANLAACDVFCGWRQEALPYTIVCSDTGRQQAGAAPVSLHTHARSVRSKKSGGRTFSGAHLVSTVGLVMLTLPRRPSRLVLSR